MFNFHPIKKTQSDVVTIASYSIERRIKWDKETAEWVCSVRPIGGVYSEDASYYTEDYNDAKQTIEHMAGELAIELFNKNGGANPNLSL